MVRSTQQYAPAAAFAYWFYFTYQVLSTPPPGA